MRRRTFLGLVTGGSLSLAGCLSAGESQTQTTPTMQSERPAATPVPEKSGTVENHRITAVEAVSHSAVRQTMDEDHEWVVNIVLRLYPQDPEVTTPFPVGVFVYFLNANGGRIQRAYRQVAANTGASSRLHTLSVPFEPANGDADTFDSYRIELVHA